jgi:exosortase/archaeosortase family protein
MNIAQQILSMKSAILFLVKLVVFYILLDFLLWGYVGAVDPRGSYYFPILNHFNALIMVLSFLLYPVKFLFQLFGYDIYFYIDIYKNGAFIGAPDLFKLHVGFPCLGFRIMTAFTSLMLAYPGYKKWLFIPLGLFFIQCINMLRIIGIIICLFNKPESMTAHEVAELSHTYFNIAVYAVIGLYFYWWVKKYGKSVEVRGA